MNVKKIFRASRGWIATTHNAFASGRTTQKMLPTGLRSQQLLVMPTVQLTPENGSQENT